MISRANFDVSKAEASKRIQQLKEALIHDLTEFRESTVIRYELRIAKLKQSFVIEQQAAANILLRVQAANLELTARIAHLQDTCHCGVTEANNHHDRTSFRSDVQPVVGVASDRFALERKSIGQESSYEEIVETTSAVEIDETLS